MIFKIIIDAMIKSMILFERVIKMTKKEEKTNAMRILDRKKLAYQCSFCDSALVNAVDVANALGQDLDAVFKTLVTTGKSGVYYVFMIPCAKELDLKKAAKATGEKSLHMVPKNELYPLTGYLHGGCSPLGTKKSFKTYIDDSAIQLEIICFSAGHVGQQINMPLSELQKAMPIIPANLTK